MFEIIVIGIVIGVPIVYILTDNLGLPRLFNKGRWVKVRYESFPVVISNLRNAKAFMNSDGIECEELQVRIEWLDNKPQYFVRIPQHVFRNVEHEVILKELGIRNGKI